MRGEQKRHAQSGAKRRGSSPHAWGTAFILTFNPPLRRFIPTCVGNRTHEASTHFTFSVHPHMRGEQQAKIIGSQVMDGSSPHAWGTAAGFL